MFIILTRFGFVGLNGMVAAKHKAYRFATRERAEVYATFEGDQIIEVKR